MHQAPLNAAGRGKEEEEKKRVVIATECPLPRIRVAIATGCCLATKNAERRTNDERAAIDRLRGTRSEEDRRRSIFPSSSSSGLINLCFLRMQAGMKEAREKGGGWGKEEGGHHACMQRASAID
jgi:hypothetical protein